MKIAVCGSIIFEDQFVILKDTLIDLGHQVDIPASEKGMKIPSITDDEFIDWKYGLMRPYFDVIASSDVILVANYDKNGINGYIGANTLIEMGVAMFLDKRIYILYDPINNKAVEEIVGMKPIILNGDLNSIGS